MDRRDDSGKAKQASEESTGNNDKGKMVATNYYGIPQHFPVVEQPNFGSTLSIAPLNMSCHMVFEQQHSDQRPIPVVGNSSMSMSSFMMEPPTSDEYMQQYISELLDEKNKIDSINYSTNEAVEYTVSFQELLGVGGGTGAVLQSSSVSAATGESMECGSEYEDLQKWVAKVKESWGLTGCSLVLDGWVDELKNRTLMNVVVDSPLGSVYLNSLDVSFAVDNVEAMELVIEAVIQDVGPRNILQIISYTTSPWLDAVAERIKARHEWMFWSVSATYCFALILERVAERIGWVQETMDKAKRVTRLASTFKQLFKDNNSNNNNHNNSNSNNSYRFVKFSKIRAAMPFLTLENMLSLRKNLQAIFTSQRFKDSSLGSSSRGRDVADMVVKDKSFWRRVMVVVKGGIPIVKLLKLMIEGKYDESRPQMGILYETMDQMKETICHEIGKKKAQDIWDIIDEVWNGTLHSPLHAAGYYVNPKLFFTEDFLADFEVMSGLMTTILKLGGNQHTQALITQQLALYENHIGDFKFGVKQADNFSPVEWWRRFGNQCPELQRFAIKVLGISCNGGSCYGLKRDVAEKLLSVSDTDPSYKMLKEQSFVSYNLRLKELKQSGTIKFNMEADAEAEAHQVYPSDDSIVE